MSDRALYRVTATATYAIVATSHRHACEIIESQSIVEHDPRGLVRESLSASLATEMPDGADADALPQWEYDIDGDHETLPSDPDVAAETSHPRRRWTIRRWVRAQRRPPEPPTVAPCDDWRGPPTAAEARAHHAAHARGGLSMWCVEIDGGDIVIARVSDHEALRWLPNESTRWRPADARLTPVAWPVIGGAR